MDKSKIGLKIKKVMCFGVFLFAFLCVGFIKEEGKIEALEVSFVRDQDNNGYIDYENNRISFKVTWGISGVDSITYCFDGNCDGDGLKELSPNPGDNIVNNKNNTYTGTYFIDISGIEATREAKSFDDNVNRNFKVKVFAESRVFGIRDSFKEDEASFCYSPPSSVPVISEVKVTVTKNELKVGDGLSFKITLNQDVYFNYGVNVSFDFSDGGSGEAKCGSKSAMRIRDMECGAYYVRDGDNGTITNVKVNNVSNIESVYGLQVGGVNDSVNIPLVAGGTVEVDGTAPSVLDVIVDKNVLSSESVFSVTVIFSESLNFGSNFRAPTLKFAFGDENLGGISCTKDNGKVIGDSDDGRITYSECKVDNSEVLTNGDKLKLLSIREGSNINDTHGNASNLSFTKIYDDVTFNEGGPVLDIEVDYVGCELYDDKNYCKTGSTVSISFNYDMKVESLNQNFFVIKFGGNVITTGVSKTKKSDDTGFIWKYNVSTVDNGQLSISYKWGVEGANGKESWNSSDGDVAYNCYVDNAGPAFSSNYGDVVSEGNVIYGTNGGKVELRFNIEDDSIVTFDDSKVELLTVGDAAIDACEGCDVSDLKKDFNGKELIISFVVNVSEGQYKLKIRVKKDAIKDYFGNTMSTDFSEELILDTKSPSFDLNVYYPEYKGFVSDNKWMLISGKSLSLMFTSSDLDLKEYCISNSSVCGDEYLPLELNKNYIEEFLSTRNGENTFYIIVRDVAGNTTSKEVSFILKDIFKYSDGVNSISKNHSIEVDVSVFDLGEQFKYAWFKKGQTLDFSGANLTVRESDTIEIEGSSSYNGEYNLCLYKVEDENILCSEYVIFDNKIDYFDVNVSDSWSNGSVGTIIAFNDSSAIKCVAVSKNVSSVNCDGGENIIVYKTSQAISPLTKYEISENAVYYLYIEDMVGNKDLERIVFDKLDVDEVKVEIFNGEHAGEYNPNLELENYKGEHKFEIYFDRESSLGSNHSLYKYFFSTSTYNIVNIDDFNAYYLKNTNRNEFINPSAKKINVVSPKECGTYNLYVLAVDAANNVSLAKVEGIKVDNEGPSIKKYDLSNKEVETVGSSLFIATFDYNFVVEDYESKLDLNNLYYNWIDNDGIKVFVTNKKYDRCTFDYNMCRINGEHIEFGEGLFSPSKTYKFELYVLDNAENMSKFTSSTFKIDTTTPVISSSINNDFWYNNNSFSFTVSKENNVGTLDEISYCVNDCLVEGLYNKDNFISLSVNNHTKETKTISLLLNEGSNDVYVYARDVFGNYKYEKYVVNYDKSNADLVVNNGVDGVVDLSDSKENAIEFTVSDTVSGLQSYCVYLSDENKGCYELNGVKNKTVKYEVSENGTYYIEIKDSANNAKVYGVVVEGIDIEPIAFDLVSSVKEGKFTNSSVTITVSNIHDSLSDDCVSEIKFIDYISVAYGSVTGNYDNLFEDDIVNVYSKENGVFIDSFAVNENKTYVVRVIDDSDNVSYRHINISSIDKDNPVVDMNTYGNGSDRILLYGENGNVSKNGATGKYEYANDTIIVRVGEESLKDRYTGYNSQLSLKICFKYEDGNCNYETYLLKTKLNSNKDYLVNNRLEITAPYDFSGEIRYYVEDGAGNVSSTKVINVEYALNVNSPIISYSVKNNGNYNSYKNIYNEVYISGSTKLRITDIDLDYFEVYSNDVLRTRCYVNDSLNDVDCIKNEEGEIGFKLENGVVHYYLDSGNYQVKAYDLALNEKVITIVYDNGKPEIEVYKKVGETYNSQVVGTQNVFNSIEDLYVKVNDNNFSYMNVDLYNSKNYNKLNSVVRYSYMSDLGKCMYDSSVCEKGASLSELLSVDTKGYNQILVTVYDKANNYSEIVIAFDNETPVISLKNVGDTIYVNGIVYTVKENTTIDVQIGANNRITLDNLLKEIIIDVDGYTYSQVNGSNLFTLKTYSGSDLYNGNIFDEIGTYEVVVSYIDEANNVAVPKSIIININDDIKPEIEDLNSSDKVEIKENVVLNGVLVKDNYGLELVGSNLIKEKILNIEAATSCSLVSNDGDQSCDVSRVGENTYRFTLAGTYTFVYTVSDISGNTFTYNQVIYVNDNKGPVMEVDGESNITIEVLNRNENGSINVNNVVVNYPSSFDVGDNVSRSVSYVGLFTLNNMKEKYKITNDIYKISDEDGVVTYRFDKVGTYYLRFTSSDNSGNVSIFEYEVVVVDKTAPNIISDLSEEQIVTIKLDDKFDVRDIIEQYNYSARDNYDEEVLLTHEVTINENNTYKITVRAVDSSNNSSSSVFYVNIVDDEAPVVGELVIDASTNSNVVKFRVVGGEDNSNNFYYEYRVQGGNWSVYNDDSVISFGRDFSSTVSVCVRAKDYSNNASSQVCKDILVDTKKPLISGVNDGFIYDKEVVVSVTDDRLESVVVLFNDEEVSYDSLPVSLYKIGRYSIIARDLVGNESVVNFIINVDVHMDVVNDLNASDYTVSSIDFDKRLLVKSDITYNSNGDSMITVKLDGITVKDDDVLYILGVVPFSENTFVMFSTDGKTYDNYKEGITLVGYGSSFKEGINNEDCLLKLNNDYYAYLIIKSDVENTPVLAEKENESKDNSGTLKIVLAVLGSLSAIIVGYQIVKLRRRVRAA